MSATAARGAPQGEDIKSANGRRELQEVFNWFPPNSISERQAATGPTLTHPAAAGVVACTAAGS